MPTLGLKRGLGQNAVIAPYASILACMYDPKAALANLGRLREVGALGVYGFHDAVDFTPTRVPEGQKCAVVRNYYAHHHGMSIAAVANVVFTGRLREWFHADPVIEAAELLLQEKAPRDIPIMNAKREPESLGKGQDDLLRPEVRVIENPLAQDRETVFLSNGHYRRHADGNRCRLCPLERPVGHPLEAGPGRGPHGHLHFPARHDDGRLVVGHRRAPARRRRKAH